MDNVIFKSIISDLSTFADEEEDLIYDYNGNFSIQRHGELLSFKISALNDAITVEYNGRSKPYTKFLAEDLAHLNLLADRILKQKKPNPDLSYINNPASLFQNSKKTTSGDALEMLKEECDTPLIFGTKIDFVTADAGHGKTMLLTEFQYKQAQRYANGEADYIFLHIDLHGRDLVRLNEAIMYELGELRFTGLFYTTVITLMKRNLIHLGIDGFDELAAEVGGERALGSLSDLVDKLNGNGIMMAASRRTFFNTQDYIKRSGLLGNFLKFDGEFHELKLHNWQRKQCVEFMDNYSFDGEDEYDKMVSLLNSVSHPLLERPYLFTKLVRFSFDENINPSEFISTSNANNQFAQITNVIEAFVKREVNKWKDTDKVTGKPYLTFDQHINLLSEIASEMWTNQRDTISIDSIQIILTLLFEEWKIEDKNKPQIIRMAESHAFLLPVPSKSSYRKFDHEEFKNFFLARDLVSKLERLENKENHKDIINFLSLGQLPDSVAQYLSYRIDKTKAIDIVKTLADIKSKEWKPTYLQPNIGTITAYLLDNAQSAEHLYIQSLSFSSLVMENKQFSNITFKDCSFINISFKNTVLNNINFEGCTFSDIRIYKNSQNRFNNVIVGLDNDISIVTVIDSENDQMQEYSPSSKVKALKKIGLKFANNVEISSIKREVKNHKFYKTVKKFLNKYISSAYQYEKNIVEDPIYGSIDSKTVINEIIPMLIKHDIIEEKETRQTVQALSRAWVLKKINLDEVMSGEEDSNSPAFAFWQEVYDHE